MPQPPPSREEIEIRKMDRLLALSDAKINIVTPIPGDERTKKKKKAVKAEGEDDDEGGVAAGEGGAAAAKAAEADGPAE
jgi:hypothetical protein